MKKNNIRSIILVSCLIFTTISTYNSTAWHHYDFDENMKRASFDFVVSRTINDYILGYPATFIYDSFKELYNRFNITTLVINETPKIPKIIHQIWLGKDIPEEFKKFQLSWQKFHPDWEYRLWTDKDVKNLPMINSHFFNESYNYGEKSDIMRYEILYEYGGVYVDFDFECLRPLDILHHTCDFYTGIQPLDSDYIQLGVAIIGARPGHPIIKHCIDTVKDDWNNEKGPMARTGAIHFTRSFLTQAGKDNSIDIPFPAMFFYPLGSKEYGDDYTAWLAAGAFAIHHWAKTWLIIPCRRPKFRSIKNY